MLNSLAFTSHDFGHGPVIDATIDGTPMEHALGHPQMLGLSDNDEWRITARTLQGWMPQELGLDREEFVPVGKPSRERSPYWVAMRQVTEVLVTLPGGDRPEVLAEDVEGLVSYDSVPMLGCDCGGGVGCAHESVTVSFERAFVRWEHGRLLFRFARTAYDAAIEELLVLLGEAPRLISDEEWTASMHTRVVRVS